MLPDGAYDVFVVDADADAEGDGVRLELTITSGDHKGEVVPLRAANLARDAVMLIGLPGTLRVEAGIPTVDFD